MNPGLVTQRRRGRKIHSSGKVGAAAGMLSFLGGGDRGSIQDPETAVPLVTAAVLSPDRLGDVV